MLAEESPPPEVRHAADFLRAQGAVDVVAELFLAQHGQGALPLAAPCATHDMLAETRRRLSATAVVCNSSLLAVLSRSALIGDAAAMLAQAQAQAKEIHTLETLPTEQLQILRSALALARR
jgi:hypothetical protein